MSDKITFGYLREHSSKCPIDPPNTYTGLDVYLRYIFPRVDDWIHDKTITNTIVDGVKLRRRPDYRSESLKMIVEFDGIQHYQNPFKIISDDEATIIYENLGYKVVRIPFFIQLTRKSVISFFNVDVGFELFDASKPSLGLKWKNTPAFMCWIGLERMAREMLQHPEQFKVNMHELEKISDERLSGLSIFKSIVNGMNKEVDFE